MRPALRVVPMQPPSFSPDHACSSSTWGTPGTTGSGRRIRTRRRRTGETPEERAIALRAIAAHAGDAGQWGSWLRRLDRGRARGAGSGGQWESCLRRLDRARALDPDGDRDPRVQELRARADNGLLSALTPSRVGPGQEP